MKKAVYIFALTIICLTACDSVIITSDVKTLPFENDDIRLEQVSASAPDFIRDIHFFNSSDGIAVTSNGIVFKTTDNGLTWINRYNDLSFDQQYFQTLFLDENIGYVVGGNTGCSGTGCIPPGGVILKTIDGGNNFSIIYELDNEAFISMSSNSTGELFVVSNGTESRISKSTDGGITWEIIHTVNYDLKKITFSNDFGFCTGMDGNILKSTDNGNTWILTTTLDALYATDIKFNTNNGFCIANNSTVYKTTDDGTNWLQNFQTEYNTYVLNPLTENSCLVFGAGSYSGGCFGSNNGGITQTTNGGTSWTETEISGITDIRSSSFYSDTEGYVIAGNEVVKVLVK